MALVKCKECGNEVSTAAKSCPKCGAKIKKPVGTLGILILLIAGPIIVAVLPQGQKGTTTQNSGSANEAKLQKDLLAAMPKDKRWSVKIDKAEPRSVMASVVYNASPLSLAEVEGDTKRVARKILEVLQANGHKPRADWASVIVFGQKPTRGETGAALVTMYGDTVYDFNNDRLVFKPAKE